MKKNIKQPYLRDKSSGHVRRLFLGIAAEAMILKHNTAAHNSTLPCVVFRRGSKHVTRGTLLRKSLL